MSIKSVTRVSHDHTKPSVRSIKPLTSYSQCILCSNFHLNMNWTGWSYMDQANTSKIIPSYRLIAQTMLIVMCKTFVSICWLLSAQGVILMVVLMTAASVSSDCFYSGSEVAVATINTRQQQSHHWMGLKWRRQDGHGKRCNKCTSFDLLIYLGQFSRI